MATRKRQTKKASNPLSVRKKLFGGIDGYLISGRSPKGNLISIHVKSKSNADAIKSAIKAGNDAAVSKIILSERPRKRNTTIIKAKKIGRIIIRKKPSVANPYAYQIQFQRPGEKVQYAGAYYTSSRTDALKQAEADLKKRRLWKPKTKLITGAVPLNSTAAKHKNWKSDNAKAWERQEREQAKLDAKKNLYGVFVWRSDAMYSKSDAIKTYKSEKLAEKFADANLDKNYVVRNLRYIVRNPASSKAVRKIRQDFTGMKSRKTALLNAPKGTPANLAKLGKLISIKARKGTLRPGRRNPGSVVWLCADARGKLHLATSGDRLIDGPAQSFGEIREIEYEAIKPHLGHKRPTIFFHHMGEEGGKRPELVSDGAGGLKIKGGSYYITPEGIRD